MRKSVAVRSDRMQGSPLKPTAGLAASLLVPVTVGIFIGGIGTLLGQGRKDRQDELSATAKVEELETETESPSEAQLDEVLRRFREDKERRASKKATERAKDLRRYLRLALYMTVLVGGAVLPTYFLPDLLSGDAARVAQAREWIGGFACGIPALTYGFILALSSNLAGWARVIPQASGLFGTIFPLLAWHTKMINNVGLFWGLTAILGVFLWDLLLDPAKDAIRLGDLSGDSDRAAAGIAE